MLIVLDNFEQIVGGAPALADVLAQAPDVKVLVTSREPLHIAGEWIFPVPPLALPDPRRERELDAIAAYAAVQLFVLRAQSVLPGFALRRENAVAVATLCVQLDGLPLALELAAARIPCFAGSDGQATGRASQATDGGARDLPQRQRTLRGTLQWSHELLDESERKLFADLAVFAGDFTLEAAEGICDADIAVIGSLLDKSMLRRIGERFAMLETIREFALEQLALLPEAGALRARHAAWFAAVAERVYARRWHDDKAGSTSSTASTTTSGPRSIISSSTIVPARSSLPERSDGSGTCARISPKAAGGLPKSWRSRRKTTLPAHGVGCGRRDRRLGRRPCDGAAIDRGSGSALARSRREAGGRLRDGRARLGLFQSPTTPMRAG
jgi:predicted ATPase